jgi:CubicO group peptidase (beta-lactamase class C family)
MKIHFLLLLSNSKAFTAAALAILVDEGKIGWDTHVTDIIPEFKLYDPYVTNEFTIRDLLTHRSVFGTWSRRSYALAGRYSIYLE